MSKLEEVRKSIVSGGANEVNARDQQESLRDLFREKQELILEMNQAKKLAAEEAAKPYLETIKEIDEQYLLILSLTNSEA